ILLIAVIIFFRKTRPADGIALEEVEQLRAEKEQLKIALAKAEERAMGLAAERDKADRQMLDERHRFDTAINTLNQDLLKEQNRVVKAEEYFKAQRERLAEQAKTINDVQQTVHT